MTCNVHNLFPFPVCEALLEGDLISKDVKFIFDKIKKKNVLRENCKNSITADSFVLDQWNLEEIKQNLLKILKVFTDEVLGYEYEKFYITQSWVNVNPPGTSHDYHNHKNSVLSGVLFLNTAPNCGDMILYKPEKDITPKVTFDPDNYFTWNNRYFSPINNQLLIFPSNLYHSVSTNNSQINRVSLAFNTFMSPLGYENSKTFAEVL